nr:MAG TPA: hypothetical protein [Caudoviricetes sp.]
MERYIEFDPYPTLDDDLTEEDFDYELLQEIESIPKKELNKIIREIDSEVLDDREENLEDNLII